MERSDRLSSWWDGLDKRLFSTDDKRGDNCRILDFLVEPPYFPVVENIRKTALGNGMDDPVFLFFPEKTVVLVDLTRRFEALHNLLEMGGPVIEPDRFISEQSIDLGMMDESPLEVAPKHDIGACEILHQEIIEFPETFYGDFLFFRQEFRESIRLWVDK